MSLAVATLRALAAPRRLLPIAIVATPLLIEQAQAGLGPLLVGSALCAACVTVAPITWRKVAVPELTLRGLAAYALIGAAVVIALGLSGPPLAGFRISFLTEPWNLTIALALYWVGGWGLGRDIEHEASLVRQRARADALEREAERAQLFALRAQLDPHFLFNTLNAIAEWCRLDGAVAEQAVLHLASMLRALLAGVRAEWWPLEQELALVDALFALYRLRDPGLFSVETQIEPTASRCLVPPLVILPLAENAMKHGPAAGHVGTVALTVTQRTDRLHVELTNPGAYRGPRAGSDGLPTVERRLRLAYGDRAQLSIDSDGASTRVLLALPVRAE